MMKNDKHDVWCFKNGDPRKFLILSDQESKMMRFERHLQLDLSSDSQLSFDDCMALISSKWPIDN